MANPSAAHEPSMEEILASIRQIISEDSEDGSPTDPIPAKAAAAPAATVAPEKKPEPLPAIEPPSESFSQDFEPEPASPPMIELAAPIEPPPTRPQELRRAADALSEPYVPPRSPVERPPSRVSDPADALLSREHDAAISGAFGALAHTMLTQSSRTLEDVVEEMLRPMLKGWLDDNLPSLVERLVKDEIERVSRGRR